MTTPPEVAQARLYLDSNRPELAIRELMFCLRAEPDNPQALALLAQAHMAANRGVEGASRAWEFARRRVQLTPDEAFAWRIMASIESRMGRYGDAQETARRARKLEPGDWLNHAIVAQIDANARDISVDTRESVETALRLAPDNPDVHMTAGRVASIDKRVADAKRHYAAALAIDPSHGAARHNLAVEHMRRGDAGAAAAGFIGVLSADPRASLAARVLHSNALRSLRTIALVLWIAASAIFFASSAADGLTARLVAIGLSAATGITIAAYVGWVRRRAGVYFGRFARSIVGRDRPLAIWLVLLACCTCAVVIADAMPIVQLRMIVCATGFVLFGCLVWIFFAQRNPRASR